jgi:ABC-type methionine transport system ATPase subunit
MTEMAKRAVKLTFPPDLIQEPVTFRMAKQFDIMPNIRRARVTDTVGELVLELEGSDRNLEAGLRYLREQGVEVNAIEGDVIE